MERTERKLVGNKIREALEDNVTKSFGSHHKHYKPEWECEAREVFVKGFYDLFYVWWLKKAFSPDYLVVVVVVKT